MGWDRLLELIPEPALLISDKGISQNTAWRATLGAAPQSLSALASQLNCDDLTGRLQRCLSSGQDLVADVSFQCRLSRLYDGRLKAVPIDAHTLCCTLQSQQFKLFAELVTEHGSTLAAVYDVENVMGPSLKWTSRPNLPDTLLSHFAVVAPQGLRCSKGEVCAASETQIATGDKRHTYRTRVLRLGPTSVMTLSEEISDLVELRSALDHQHLAREVVVEERSTWHRFFENSPVMMAIVEFSKDDVVFTVINHAMHSVLRQAATSNPTLPFTAASLGFPADDIRLFVSHLTESAASSAPVQFDYPWPKEFAQNRPYFYTSCWVNPLSGSRFALVCKDITDRIMADQRLRAHERELETLVVARTKQLESALTVKSRFLATMSHEIRTPLSGIIGSLSLLGDTQLTLEQKDLVSLAQLCGEQLLLLINDILDHTRLAEAKVKLEIAPFNIEAMVEEVLGMMAYPAEQKAIELVSQIEPNTVLSAMGDAHRVRQVLVNLMSNAAKFTSVGHVLLKVSSRTLPDNRVEFLFTVADTGTGIEPEIAANLFQPFTQGDSSMSRRYGGSGLGLYISKSIANLMEGSVWFESSPGKGSTFYFSMTATQGRPTPEIERNVPPNKHVWVCVPSDVLRDALQQLLVSWGFRVSAFASLEAALSSVHNAHPQHCVALIDTNFAAEGILALSCRVQAILIGSSRRAIPPELQQLPFVKKPAFNQALKRQLLALLSPTARQEPAALPKVPSCQDPNLTILIADDQPTNQMIIRKLLATLGYAHLRFVENGRQAVDAVLEAQYDVVLMDVMMPEMNGVDATLTIRRHKPHLPVIIAVTANAFIEDQEKYTEAGMDGIITKPIRLGELKAALDKSAQELPMRRARAHAHAATQPQVPLRSSLAGTTAPGGASGPASRSSPSTLPNMPQSFDAKDRKRRIERES